MPKKCIQYTVYGTSYTEAFLKFLTNSQKATPHLFSLLQHHTARLSSRPGCPLPTMPEQLKGPVWLTVSAVYSALMLPIEEWEPAPPTEATRHVTVLLPNKLLNGPFRKFSNSAQSGRVALILWRLVKGSFFCVF